MKKLWLLCLLPLVLCAGCGVFFPDTREMITEDTTWRWYFGDVVLGRDVVVAKSATLFIEPGVTVKMAAGYGIVVEGRLDARGTPVQPVKFTGWDGKKWNGIRFADKQDGGSREAGHFEYCRFEGGGVVVDTGYVTVKHSKFADINGPGIYSGSVRYGERTDVLNTAFENCEAGIESRGESLVSARYCEFKTCKEAVRVSGRYGRAEAVYSNFYGSVNYNFVNESLANQEAGGNYWGNDNTSWIEYKIYDAKDKNLYGYVLYGTIFVIPRVDAGTTW
jgi:hypothetical protein